MQTWATGNTWPLAFFVRRWQRRVPLSLLFWRDMILVGSLLNLAAAFAGLMALALKAELAVALAVFHAPLPYNLFLVGAIWRSATMTDQAKASTARAGALLWLAVMTVL